MKRLIYRAQIKNGYEEKVIDLLKKDKQALHLVKAGHSMVFAAFYWERNIFAGIGDYLEDWPGKQVKRKWIPMVGVFHFNEPVSAEHWVRKGPVDNRKGRVAHLKPEMVSSYIYYHYQLQEERAFLGPKYEIIAMHENLLFGYQEFPAVVEEPLAVKKLNTSGTPVNWNDSRMDLHFQPWEDGYLYFKHIDTIFAYYEE